MITHEPDVADQAKRVVRLSDGEIVEDRRAVGLHDSPPEVLRQKSRRRVVDSGSGALER
jgi:ABC-type lipoprotein export system ATPase subunit